VNLLQLIINKNNEQGRRFIGFRIFQKSFKSNQKADLF